MRYVILALVALMVVAVGYIYIEKAPNGETVKKKSNGQGGAVDDFLSAPDPIIDDEPKVILIDDFEAEKAKRRKKKD